MLKINKWHFRVFNDEFFLYYICNYIKQNNMKRISNLVKRVFASLTSYDAASKKFGYRLYSKEFIESQR
jgi:hypothetical protein